MSPSFITVHGNEAAARIAHLTNEVVAICPLTPAFAVFAARVIVLMGSGLGAAEDCVEKLAAQEEHEDAHLVHERGQIRQPTLVYFAWAGGSRIPSVTRAGRWSTTNVDTAPSPCDSLRLTRAVSGLIRIDRN